MADTGNRRVLVWNSLPTTSAAPADVVIGAPGFGEPPFSGVEARSLDSPIGLASIGRVLLSSEYGAHRVQSFRLPPRTADAAIGRLGQTDPGLGARNDSDQDGVSDGFVTSRTLSETVGLRVTGDRLYVADAANHRVLVFERRR